MRSRILRCAVWLAVADLASAQPPRARVAHVLVALADNQYQGIVPVPPALGNGDDPGHNLYWGAGYGLRTFFKKSADWELIGKCEPAKSPILERCVFRSRHQNVSVVADAYRGREIKRAINDFFAFAAGRGMENLPAGGTSDLVAYVGHDGLMDFKLDRYEYSADTKHRDAVILACSSRTYFADALRWTGAKPLLWTRGLLAPEAYVIEAALAGWARNETGNQVRTRAAQAYDKYQHTESKASLYLFTTGW